MSKTRDSIKNYFQQSSIVIASLSSELESIEKIANAIGAIHLANNSSAITAWTNDFEFNTYFTRQVEALGNKGDILFLITTGGGNRENGASMNLVYAAEKAKELGLKIITISGKGGGILKDFSDLSIVVKSNETANIQEGHIAIIHSICYCLDEIDLNKS